MTGASSGLGKAAAVELARRGGNMILACRPGHAEIPDEIRRLSGSETVELMEVDLADMASVHRFCDRLTQRGIHIDIALLNAGVMPRTARKTPQGYETMFAVHFPRQPGADRPLGAGRRDSAGQPRRRGSPHRVRHLRAASVRRRHRLRVVSGRTSTTECKDGVRHYGASKLVQCTYATELSRRLNPGDQVTVAVHAMCPGGVATNIAREAPPLAEAGAGRRDAPHVPVPGTGDRARHLPLLRGGTGQRHGDVPAHDAAQVRVSRRGGSGDRGPAVGSQRTPRGQIAGSALNRARTFAGP